MDKTRIILIGILVIIGGIVAFKTCISDPPPRLCHPNCADHDHGSTNHKAWHIKGNTNYTQESIKNKVELYGVADTMPNYKLLEFERDINSDLKKIYFIHDTMVLDPNFDYIFSNSTLLNHKIVGEHSKVTH